MSKVLQNFFFENVIYSLMLFLQFLIPVENRSCYFTHYLTCFLSLFCCICFYPPIFQCLLIVFGGSLTQTLNAVCLLCIPYSDLPSNAHCSKVVYLTLRSLFWLSIPKLFVSYYNYFWVIKSYYYCHSKVSMVIKIVVSWNLY